MDESAKTRVITQFTGFSGFRYIIKRSWEGLREIIGVSMNNLILHIMPAGVEFLRHIVASFEFFSMRCFKRNKYVPLFVTIPTPDVMLENWDLKNLKCIKIFDRVSQYAQTCMSIAQDNSMVDFRFINRLGAAGMRHDVRIKNDHLYYFDVFKRYINDHYINEESRLYDHNAAPVRKKYQAIVDKIQSFEVRYNH